MIDLFHRDSRIKGQRPPGRRAAVGRFSAAAVIVIVLLMVFLPAQQVSGHYPIFEEEDSSSERPFVIQTPDGSIEQSIAVYARFDRESDIDYYRFTLSRADFEKAGGRIKLHLGSLVPACRPCEKLLTRLELTGPEQPTLPGGLFVLENKEQGRLWYEPFSFKSYYYQRQADLFVTRPGVYTLTVRAVNGQRGDYVLELGDAESWGFYEVFTSLWPLIKLWFDAEISTEDCDP